MMNLIDRYHGDLAPIRACFPERSGLRMLFEGEAPDALLFAFLIEFAARGVAITEPVDGWIRAAGERCRAMDLADLGDRLIRHARSEEGHHRLHVRDVHALVHLWNASGRPRLDAQALLARPAGPAAIDYIDLHRGCIEGDQPYRQVAIEREIEGLSVSDGSRIVDRVRARLGAEVVAAMSFLQEHVAVDVGHSAFNERLLENLLKVRPDALEGLVEAGTQALTIYGSFIQECLESARSLVASSAGWSSSEHFAVVPVPSTDA